MVDTAYFCYFALLVCFVFCLSGRQPIFLVEFVQVITANVSLFIHLQIGLTDNPAMDPIIQGLKGVVHHGEWTLLAISFILLYFLLKYIIFNFNS